MIKVLKVFKVIKDFKVVKVFLISRNLLHTQQTIDNNSDRAPSHPLRHQTQYVLYVKSAAEAPFVESEFAESEAFTITTEQQANRATYTLTFSSTTMQQSVQNYTTLWKNIVDGNTWSIANFNNNQKKWQYIKCGSNKATSIATITTDWAIAEAIEKVIVTIDSVTTASINSTYLEVATDADFSNIVETVTVSIAQGDLVYAIINHTENCYYRLTYDCKKALSNGPVQISKVVYTNE